MTRNRSQNCRFWLQRVSNGFWMLFSSAFPSAAFLSWVPSLWRMQARFLTAHSLHKNTLVPSCFASQVSLVAADALAFVIPVLVCYILLIHLPPPSASAFHFLTQLLPTSHSALHHHRSFSLLTSPLLQHYRVHLLPQSLPRQTFSCWAVKSVPCPPLYSLHWCCSAHRPHCLPGCVRFRCSSPSCIPCPPPVKWLWHYTAGRAPSCRTASLSVRLSIAKAGRSLVELQSDRAHASVSVPVCLSHS